MNRCPHCGATARSRAKNCSKCGKQLAQASTTIPNSTAGAASALSSTGVAKPPVGLPATRQLTAPPPALTRLQRGELLHQDQYEVLDCLQETASRNLYLVKDRQTPLCSTCQHRNKPDSKFCESCGAPLADRYAIALESFSSQEFAHVNALLQIGIHHPGLVNLQAAFTSRLFGHQDRTYVLIDPILADRAPPGVVRGTRLAALTPIAPQQALAWLREIAQTLEYLRSKNVHFDGLTLNQILVVEQQSRLTGLEQLRAFTKPELPTVISHSVRQIARLCQEMVAPASLPPILTTVLQKAVAGESSYTTPQALLAELTRALPASQHPAGGLTLRVGSLTDLGLVREINEDSLLTLTIDQYHNSLNTPTRLYAVADGMGGHAAGEVASQLVIKALAVHLIENFQHLVAGAQPVIPDYAQLLKQACLHAAREVYESAHKMGADMGATLVAALMDLDGRKVYAANVGDSRLYKINQTRLTQITKDHSMVQLLVDKQKLTPEQARHHPQANLIYRTLGEKPTVEVDIFTATIAPGDYLLLCSDGLSGKVDDAQLQKIVLNQPTPQAACQELVQRAKQAGGDDNITVIVIQVESTSSPPKA